MALNNYIQLKIKKENKTEHVGDFRITKETKNKLKEKAKQNNISVAELIRILIKKGLEI